MLLAREVASDILLKVILTTNFLVFFSSSDILTPVNLVIPILYTWQRNLINP